MRPLSFVAPWIASLALFAACSRPTAHPIEAAGDTERTARASRKRRRKALPDRRPARPVSRRFGEGGLHRPARAARDAAGVPGHHHSRHGREGTAAAPGFREAARLFLGRPRHQEPLLRRGPDDQVRRSPLPRSPSAFHRTAARVRDLSAYGQVRLTLEGDDRKVYDLRTGYIAEIDGRYKFIGFGWNEGRRGRHESSCESRVSVVCVGSRGKLTSSFRDAGNCGAGPGLPSGPAGR